LGLHLSGLMSAFNHPIDRRRFLRSSSLIIGTTSLVPLLAQEAPRRRPLRKAIMWGTVGAPGSVMEKATAVKEAGFEGIEPNGGMDQDEVLRAMEALGLEAASVCCHTHWAKPLSDPVPSVRETGLEGLRQSLRDAKRYGAGSVLLVPAVVNERVSYAEAWDRSVAEIQKAVPLAEELGVTISVENVWNNFLLSPLEAVRYVDQFNSPRVGWHFDIGNVIAYGWPEQWIRILGKRIQRLHFKEYSRKKADAEGRRAGFNVEFLKGDNNWPAVMKALDEIGYTGWGIAEQGGGGSAEGLKKLSTEMTQIFAS
jgi:L-ribulose-5-phosphate 3-epimerase